MWFQDRKYGAWQQMGRRKPDKSRPRRLCSSGRCQWMSTERFEAFTLLNSCQRSPGILVIPKEFFGIFGSGCIFRVARRRRRYFWCISGAFFSLNWFHFLWTLAHSMLNKHSYRIQSVEIIRHGVAWLPCSFRAIFRIFSLISVGTVYFDQNYPKHI